MDHDGSASGVDRIDLNRKGAKRHKRNSAKPIKKKIISRQDAKDAKKNFLDRIYMIFRDF